MKEGFRVQRVERELLELISEYFQKKLPLPAMTTVTRVQSNEKLRTAVVFISVMGDDDQKEETLDMIKEDLYTMQGYLNRKMHMKFVPRVKFELDLGLDHMMKIQDMLSEED